MIPTHTQIAEVTEWDTEILRQLVANIGHELHMRQSAPNWTFLVTFPSEPIDDRQTIIQLLQKFNGWPPHQAKVVLESTEICKITLRADKAEQAIIQLEALGCTTHILADGTTRFSLHPTA